MDCGIGIPWGLLFPHVGLPVAPGRPFGEPGRGTNCAKFSGSVELAASLISFFGEREDKVEESITLTREKS